VGLTSNYLKSDPEMFEVFRQKLAKRFNKHYHELLNQIAPENFVWQVKIMWKLLKRKQRNERTYGQIRKAITTSKHGKRFDMGKAGGTAVSNKPPKQSKHIGFAYEMFGHLTPVEETRIRKALKILQRINFTWERNPIEVFKEQLDVVGLNLDIFGKHLILFINSSINSVENFKLEGFMNLRYYRNQ